MARKFDSRIPVVGIGASSGGLAAFSALLTNLPNDTGMAFVFIQHLNSENKSHLAELLARVTTMPVKEVKARTLAEANHVYVITPDRNLQLAGGYLRPTKRAEAGRNLPIDAFLTGLAKEQRDQAIGVILSGTGSDGTLGLKAIRAQGGATFVQDLKSAKFSEMPRSAIGLGVVDFVLPATGIARQLTLIAEAAARPTSQESDLPGPEIETSPEMLAIFQILRRATGVDFTHYKASTIRRRIRRRMAMQGFKTLRVYSKELSKNQDEAIALSHDFFITVTSFFRDPAMLLELKKTVFPALLSKQRAAHKALRIWVPGCATGEEAYSLAMCLTEFLEENKSRLVDFQVFATDVNETVIEKARAGIFGKAAMTSVSPKRRVRFFTKTEQGYQVTKSLRETCVFAQQNLVKDPPFSRIDLVSCCNVLIYLGHVLQRKAISAFHYALRPEGFLALGTSESIGSFTDLFQQVSKKNKLFRRQAARGDAASGAAFGAAFDAARNEREDLPERWKPSGKALEAEVRTAQAAAAAAAATGRLPKIGKTASVAELRQELVRTREYLQSLIAGKEAALQELRAVHQEAQAGNEELETAQEELQSVNEELNTLNEDLRLRNVQLGQLNVDLNTLQESISIPLVMVGKDLRIRRFTRAIAPLLNIAASDIGKPINSLRPEIHLADIREHLQAVMAGRTPQPMDVRDSRGHWYSRCLLPAVNADGKIDGAVFMLIDIDAQKRGRDFAEAIVESLHEPLLILRKNLEVAAANKAFYRTFQVSPEETLGRQIYALGDGQWDIPRLHELLHQILPAHSTFRNLEVDHNFERVGRKVMLLNASEVFDPNAKEQTILLAIEDITERKRAEETLKTMNVELQHFAYALTHDLREPLRMVVNFTELLAQDYRGMLGQEADQYIEYSVEGARRMEALMKALLSYWETGALDHGETLIDSGAVLQKTLRNLDAAITDSKAIITTGPLPTLLAEEAMLLQLFQNLIANAIKYRDGNVPRIHISAEDGASAWLFSVRDNGIGIDLQYTERIFGIFKRLHGSDIPGTGIGLALCKKIVERRGGKIWVESKLGHGSTFKFTIPTRVSRPMGMLDG